MHNSLINFWDIRILGKMLHGAEKFCKRGGNKYDKLFDDLESTICLIGQWKLQKNCEKSCKKWITSKSYLSNIQMRCSRELSLGVFYKRYDKIIQVLKKKADDTDMQHKQKDLATIIFWSFF